MLGNLGSFMVKPSYHFWAQWIGLCTRKDNLVFNTEYRKCHKITEQGVSDPSNLPNYSEEDLPCMMNFAHFADERSMFTLKIFVCELCLLRKYIYNLCNSAQVNVLQDKWE